MPSHVQKGHPRRSDAELLTPLGKGTGAVHHEPAPCLAELDKDEPHEHSTVTGSAPPECSDEACRRRLHLDPRL